MREFQLNIRLAFKEILGHRRFSILLLSNIAIGLIGLILIENFKSGFQTQLDDRGLELLGSNLSIVSRQKITALKEKEISRYMKQSSQSKGLEVLKIKTLFSMAKGPLVSRLIYLHTYQKGFPFYGKIALGSGDILPSEKYLGENEVWVYPELLSQLKMKVGQGLNIGGTSFKIKDIVIDDSQQTFEMGSVAPKVFISEAGVERAGLIQKGSTIRYNFLYKTKQNFSKSEVEEIEDLIADPSIKVITPKKSSDNIGRLLTYLSDFLGLVGIVALFLSGIGIFYLLRGYLSSKKKVFALYHSLGIKRKSIVSILRIQILIYSFLGMILALSLSSLLIPLINEVITSSIPIKLPFFLASKSLILSFLMGPVSLFLLSWPLLKSLTNTKLVDLFQEIDQESKALFTEWVRFIPYGLFFLGMTFYVSRSFIVGGSFTAVMLAVLLIFLPLGALLLKKIGQLNTRHYQLKLGLRYLSRYRLSSLSIFMALMLGTLLLCLIPQIQKGLESELALSETHSTPSLFLFDIQDEQREQLENFFEEQDIELLSMSPLIRSRLLEVNGKTFSIDQSDSLTREQEREKRFRNRGISLSYRNKLSWSEKVIEGRPISKAWSESSGELPKISVEKRYAQRMKIKLGDRLKFDILGIELEAQIANIRSIKWTSFLPNFFLQFQQGVLEDAPKTWLAAVPSLDPETRNHLQSALFDQFPNVSAVDISRVVSKILNVINQMGWALKSMSFLCLLVGLVVMTGLVRHQFNERVSDIALLKLIGLSSRQLKKMMVLEFSILAFFASTLGTGLSILLSFLAGQAFFDGIWGFGFLSASLSVGLITLLAGLVSFLSVSQMSRVSPQIFLQKAV